MVVDLTTALMPLAGGGLLGLGVGYLLKKIAKLGCGPIIFLFPVTISQYKANYKSTTKYNSKKKRILTVDGDQSHVRWQLLRPLYI